MQRQINYEKAAFWLIILVTIIRVLLADIMGLGIDESYAVTIAKTFSWSYLDHPPLHFWLTRLSSVVFGSHSHLVVRLPSLVCAFITMILLYRLSARVYSSTAGFFALVFYAFTPIANYFGIAVLPDGPLLPLMLAAVMCAHTMMCKERSASVFVWLGFGVFAGLAILSKYTGVMLYLGLLLFASWDDKLFKLLKNWKLYFSGIVSLIIIAPIFVWNIENHWISFLFQGARVKSAAFDIVGLLRVLGGQMGYLLPWVWILLVVVALRAVVLPNTKATRATKLLLCMAFGPVVLFTIPAIWGGTSMPHWAVPGWLFVMPVAGNIAATAVKANSKWPLRILWANTLVFLALIVAICTLFLAPTNSAFVQPLRQGSVEILDWDELADTYADMTRDITGPVDFIACADWMQCGKAGYALYDYHQPIICLNNTPHQFLFSTNYHSLAGKSAIVIAKSQSDELERVLGYFSTKQKLGVFYPSRMIREQYVMYYCKGYNGWEPSLIGMKKGNI